jgi:serine/threonine-protein kinase
MADVFLAVAEGPAGFTKLQVVKCIHSHLAENPEFVTMFMEEARLAALLNHPNVVQTNEVGFEGGKAYMVMEYLEGRPLQTVVKVCQKKGQPFATDLHLRAIAEILAGLHYAHELTDLSGNAMRLVHRDVTPHNVFITFDGGVKLLDFGIAKATASDPQTRDGMVKGKVRYLAPEQVQQTALDRRADIFQVGVMVFEAVTGRLYWDRELPDAGILGRLFNGDLPRIEDVPDIAPDLAAICNNALAYDPAKRYATAEQFRVDLEAALARRESKSSARDVGTRVARVFASAHVDMKKRIDEHLRAGASVTDTALTSLSGSIPSLALTATGVAGFGSGSSSVQIVGVSARGPKASHATSRAPVRRTNLMLVAGAVAGVIVVGFVGVTMLRPAQQPQGASVEVATASTPPTQPSASEAVSAVVPAKEAKVRLRLSFEPRFARVSIDGVAITSNPFVGNFSKSDAPRRIRAEAPGYEPRQFDVVLDQHQALEVRLTRLAAPSGPRGKPAPKAAPEPPPPKPPVVAVPLREDR